MKKSRSSLVIRNCLKAALPALGVRLPRSVIAAVDNGVNDLHVGFWLSAVYFERIG